jgi:CDP-glucose 4,6-dehydratase
LSAFALAPGGPFDGKVVLVTGHTGFKGSWLAEWLLMLGARVVGVALPPPTKPSLFEQLGLASRMEHHVLDIGDADGLARLVRQTQPDFVFHLAAQPLVRESYREPVATWSTNVMGTIHLLEALRDLGAEYGDQGRRCTGIFITSDKCYDNREWVHGYRENDALGGHDPYSASKAGAEIAVAAYRKSFFGIDGDERSTLGIATARAGNVIGGGDWAADRIVPDCIRHLEAGSQIRVRNPKATRPWQHVLEPLAGYLQLAAAIDDALARCDRPRLRQVCSAFNFGPALDSNRSVGELVDELLKHWPGEWLDQSEGGAPHEASRLNLVSDKAFHELRWRSSWGFSAAVSRTVGWYRGVSTSLSEAQRLTRADIEAYCAVRNE